MKYDTNRRSLIKDLAIATLVFPLSGNSWADQKFSKNPFGLGIASGSATHDSVVLWTRLFDQGIFGSNLPNENIPVKWEIAKDESFSQPIQSGISQAVSGLAHSVHVELSNLPINQWFYYRFSVGNFSSAVGKSRTFAPAKVASEPLRIAFASCQNYEQGYFNAYPHLVAEKPDLMIFLGDYIYEYPPGKEGVRSVDGGWCISLEDYRRRYALYKQEQELQAIHACCPWLVTWDDHEVQNDYAGNQEGSFGPSTNFSKRRSAAYQAYYEHMPLKASVLTEGISGLEKGAETRIYDNYRIGNLISISMLDGRQYRSPQVCTPGGKTGSGNVDPKTCSSMADHERTLLGLKQEQWLEQQFQSSEQTWNFIAQPTLFGACTFNTRDGVNIWNDGWDGYPAARKRLVDQLVKHQVSNPVILGGDVHENWVGYIKEDYETPQSKNVGVEFCGTSVCSYDGKNTVSRQMRNSHFIFSDGSRKGYAIVNISKKEMSVQLRVVKNHRQKITEIETLANFKVMAGSPLIQRSYL